MSAMERKHGPPAHDKQQLRLWALGPQAFSGNPLDRTSDAKKRFDSAPGSEPEVGLVVVAGRELVFRSAADPSASQVEGPPVQHELQVLLLASQDPQLDLVNESMSFLWSETDDIETAQRFPLYLLGQDVTGRWVFALDVSGQYKSRFLHYLRTVCGLDVEMSDLRGIMSTLSRDACAIAGHAAALSQWHQTHKFCSRCGNPSFPTEAGLKRRCEKEHKMYPRTDPVVIMLVESPDGQRALLGRSRKFAPGMYTCLSGFMEQCESIEEAVRREVREEARVPVADVQIIGSQPWPNGRYGSCELMLGCMAKALTHELLVNTGEMEDVQWYDKAELASAVDLFDSLDVGGTIEEVQAQLMDTLGFFIPPPLAIAHHLIRLWAHNPGPWFPPVTMPPVSTHVSGHVSGPVSGPATANDNAADASAAATAPAPAAATGTAAAGEASKGQAPAVAATANGVSRTSSATAEAGPSKPTSNL